MESPGWEPVFYEAIAPGPVERKRTLNMRRKMTALTMVTLVFTAAACGGEGTEPTPGAGGTTPGGTTATTATGPGTTGGGQTGGPPPGSQDFPFESGTGYFEVDGERFEPHYIVRCEPFSFGSPPHEDDLDLRGHRLSDGIGLEVEVSVRDIVAGEGNPREGYTAMNISVFLHRSGADGIEQYEGSAVNHPNEDWYDTEHLSPEILIYHGTEPTGPPLSPPAGFEIARDRIKGTMTLPQDWPENETGTVDVTFDYSIPSEEFDCDEL